MRILVPQDIVVIPRRVPRRVERKPPWRPRPDTDTRVQRPGARDWFSDRLFVEPQDGPRGAGYGISSTVHLMCLAVLIVVIGRSEPMLVRVGPSLGMPAVVSMAPFPAGGPVAPPVDTPKAAPRSLAPAAPPSRAKAAAPIEAPSGIEPDSGVESDVDGVAGGVVGGIAGGSLEGAFSPGGSVAGPLRAGDGISSPRKIKDVRPVYPQTALADQAHGTVIIEATIGVDGKVCDARLLQSAPPFDDPALDALRQWEYEPSFLHGVRVAVIMTVIINFSIQ